MIQSRETIFEETIEALNKQGGRAFDENRSSCMYRAPDGKKCAIGMRIPDELYSDRFEFSTVGELPENVLEACGFDVDRYEELSFASALQQLHDSSLNWEHGKLVPSVIERFRRTWNLK